MEFPEYLPLSSTQNIDLEIKLGQTGYTFSSLTGSRIYSYCMPDKNDFMMRIQGVASYRAFNGNSICIFPEEEANRSDVNVYVSSNAMAAILFQRNALPLHAGGIFINDELVLVMGDSGAGKSSLLFHAMQKGYRMFSDDVVVVSDTTTYPLEVHASYPQMKLWKHQLNELNHLAVFPVRKGVDKYPFYFHRCFESDPIVPKRIFILKTVDNLSGVQIQKLSGGESFVELNSFIYRKEYFNAHDPTGIFNSISQLANQSNIYLIKRPTDIDTASQVAELFLHYSRV